MITRNFGFYFHLIWLSFFISNKVNGQQISSLAEEKLLEKVALYSKANPENLLFVHTDKTLYANNETIWFSGYLIKTPKNFQSKHEIMSVALIKEDSRKVILSSDFFMKSGLSFGSLSIPDSIPPGHYQMVAYTNIQNSKGEPEAMFTQSLTIKSLSEQAFSSTLTLLDSIANNGFVRAKVAVSFTYPNPKTPQKATLSYSVGKTEVNDILLKENSLIIRIPTTQLSGLKPILLTTIKYDKQFQYLSLELPKSEAKEVKIKFFPEGGSLINGVESIVGLEAQTAYGVPIALTGILYADKKPIDTLTTNITGIGKFKLKPQPEMNYSLKVLANNFLKGDSVFNLPTALNNGIVIHIPSTIINDTLKIRLTANSKRAVKVIVHNFHKAFVSFNAEIGTETSRFSVALPLIEKGLATVNVVDEEDRPLAERSFFALYNDQLNLSVKTDQLVYGKKNKVSVNLKLTDLEGYSLPAIVSIAAVQENRLERNKLQDIESYVYLKHHLGNLPLTVSGREIKNKSYLEDILLVKGWTNYTWQKLIDTKPLDTLITSTFQQFTGRVKYVNKPLKDSITVNLIIDSKIGFITTNQDGSFVVKPEDILLEEGRILMASVSKKVNFGYDIAFNNPFKEGTKKIANSMEFPIRGIANGIQSSKDLEIKGMERAIALQAVVVTAGRDDMSIYSTAGKNACGDFVCRYNNYNCRNHYNEPDNTVPIKGKSYGNLTGFYVGCMMEEAGSKKVFKLDGIYTTREFYGVNMEPDGLLEPQYLSTLFWQPGTIIKDDGTASFSFYTGDITGKFRIVVQGIGEDEVIYGETFFEVK